MRLFPFLFQPVLRARAKLAHIDTEIVCASRRFPGARDFIVTIRSGSIEATTRLQGSLADVPLQQDMSRIFRGVRIGDVVEIEFQEHRYRPGVIHIRNIIFE